MNRFGPGELADLLADVLAQLGVEALGRVAAALHRHERDDRLTGGLVGLPARPPPRRPRGATRSADSTSIVESRWPDDVDHVVGAADDPEVAVVVAARGVADDVDVRCRSCDQ